MIKTSIYTNYKVTQLIDPATLTADTNSSSVDMQGYNECLLLVNCGESGDTLASDLKWEFEVEESADDSTFTDVADADLINYVAGTNDGCFAVVDAAAEDDARYITAYRGTSRYVRVVANAVGSVSSGMPISVTAFQLANDLPANAVTTQ
jgi:hypothetical protein